MRAALALQLQPAMGLLSKLFHRDNAIDVLDLLTSQHAELDALFEALEAREGNRRALFTELADKLAAHAAVEEKVFYPAIMAKETNELLQESVEEHLAIKRVLADLLAMDVESDRFDAALSVLKEEVTHHAREEEEGELFPKVRKLVSADELDALGGECLALFEKLMATEPRNQVPSETGKPARI